MASASGARGGEENLMALNFMVDERKFKADIASVNLGLSSIRRTIDSTGSGEVFCTRRAPDEFDAEVAKRPPWPSWRITRFLRSKGHDAFELPTQITAEAVEEMAEGIKHAIRSAFDQDTPKPNISNAAIAKATQTLRDAAKDKILTGKLGTNTAQYKMAKRRLQGRAKIGSIYGRPPPYGILTGRWVRSIEARLRLRKLGR